MIKLQPFATWLWKFTNVYWTYYQVVFTRRYPRLIFMLLNRLFVCYAHFQETTFFSVCVKIFRWNQTKLWSHLGLDARTCMFQVVRSRWVACLLEMNWSWSWICYSQSCCYSQSFVNWFRFRFVSAFEYIRTVTMHHIICTIVWASYPSGEVKSLWIRLVKTRHQYRKSAPQAKEKESSLFTCVVNSS